MFKGKKFRMSRALIENAFRRGGADEKRIKGAVEVSDATFARTIWGSPEMITSILVTARTIERVGNMDGLFEGVADEVSDMFVYIIKTGTMDDEDIRDRLTSMVLAMVMGELDNANSEKETVMRLLQDVEIDMNA